MSRRRARPPSTARAAEGSAAPAPPTTPAAQPKAAPGPPVARRYVLAVTDGRDLHGTFPVVEGGSYRFRFYDAKKKLLAEGPPIPIVIEPDAYPTVQITAPEKEVEVEPTASVEIVWQAEDDIALGEVNLVLKPPQGEEKRIPLRSGDPVRRDSGGYRLAVGPLQLGEGERLAYRVEAADTDTVSGPKVSSSDTRFIRIYSEAEHRRQMLERARQAYEELVASLGDRLDLHVQGQVNTEERLPQAQSVDARTRLMTDHLRLAARDLRRDPAGPREVAAALENVAQNVRFAVEGAISSRSRLAMAFRLARESLDEPHRRRARDETKLAQAGVERDDANVERASEKGILYLEQLLDKRRAEDLVKLAKNLSQKRRDLADLMERYRKAPTDQAKQDLVAQVRRMKEQVRDLLSRMAELSKGFNDEHMNEEALSELAKSQDLLSGLDDVEKKLAQGDVEGAMKALDQMAGAMDRMTAGLSRTAGIPDERAQALMKDMLAFKEQLQKLEQAQKDTAGETEKLRAEYRRRVAERMKDAEAALKHLHELAQGAQKDVEGARPGVTFRAEPDYEIADQGLKDLERALGMRELEGANEAVRRAQPSVERLSRYLDEDANMLDSPFVGKERPLVDDAHRRVAQAVPKVREIRDALSRLFPDPRSVMSKEEQQRLGELARRQGELEQQAGTAAAGPRGAGPQGAGLPALGAGPAGRVPRPHGRGRLRARQPQPAARPRRAGAGAGRAGPLPEGAGGRRQGHAPGRRPAGPGVPVPVRGERGRRADRGGHGPVAREGEDPGRRGAQGARGLPQGPARGHEAGNPRALQARRAEVLRGAGQVRRALAILLTLAALPLQARAAAPDFKGKDGQAAMQALSLLAQEEPDRARELLAPYEPFTKSPQGIRFAGGVLRFFEQRYPEAVELMESSGAGSLGGYLPLARAAREDHPRRCPLRERALPGLVPEGQGRDPGPLPGGRAREAARRAGRGAGARCRRPRITVEIVGDVRELAQLSTLTEDEVRTSGTVAVSKFGKLMMLSPKALLKGYDWLDTAAHEFTHYVITERTHNRAPLWMQEGLAKWFEEAWRGKHEPVTPFSAALVRDAIARKNLVTFEEMHPSLAKLPTQERAALAYAEVSMAVEWLVKQKGPAALERMTGLLGEGKSTEDSVSQAAGVPFRRFLDDWNKYMAQRPLPRGGDRELHEAPLQGRPEAGDPVRRVVGDPGRGFARLRPAGRDLPRPRPLGLRQGRVRQGLRQGGGPHPHPLRALRARRHHVRRQGLGREGALRGPGLEPRLPRAQPDHGPPAPRARPAPARPRSPARRQPSGPVRPGDPRRARQGPLRAEGRGRRRARDPLHPDPRGPGGPAAMTAPIDTTTHTEITQRVPGPEADLHAVQELHEARRVLLTEIEKRIVGQKNVVDSLLIALFARGHCLFVGVPGLAKTLLISHPRRGAGPAPSTASSSPPT